jgi:hypothetical protein
MVDAVRDVAGRRPTGTPARLAGSVKRSGPGQTVLGAGMAGRAAGRSGKAMAAYAGRKAAGRRAPLLVTLPAFAGASIAGFMAVRRMRRGFKQTVPDP